MMLMMMELCRVILVNQYYQDFVGASIVSLSHNRITSLADLLLNADQKISERNRQQVF